MKNLRVKAVDGSLDIKENHQSWSSLFSSAGNHLLDIQYGKHDGSIFVVKMPTRSAIVYEPEGLERTVVSPELFFRVKRRDTMLVQQVKQIIKGE